MKVIAILQARMSSSRLPGKVLLNLNEKTIIEHVYNNVRASNLVDEVFIATSTDKSDDQIESLCIRKKFNVYRGSLDNVLDRYFNVASEHKANIVVRITCDCPLVSSETIDNLIKILIDNNYDYASNTCPPASSIYPDGSDVEVFTFDALKKAYFSNSKYVNKEHVTFQFWQDRAFNSFQLKDLNNNYSHLRYTLDYDEDYEVIKYIYNSLQKIKKNKTSVMDIIDILDKSEIKKLNSKYYQGINW